MNNRWGTVGRVLYGAVIVGVVLSCLIYFIMSILRIIQFTPIIDYYHSMGEIELGQNIENRIMKQTNFLIVLFPPVMVVVKLFLNNVVNKTFIRIQYKQNRKMYLSVDNYLLMGWFLLFMMISYMTTLFVIESELFVQSIASYAIIGVVIYYFQSEYTTRKVEIKLKKILESNLDNRRNRPYLLSLISTSAIMFLFIFYLAYNNQNSNLVYPDQLVLNATTTFNQDIDYSVCNKDSIGFRCSNLANFNLFTRYEFDHATLIVDTEQLKKLTPNDYEIKLTYQPPLFALRGRNIDWLNTQSIKYVIKNEDIIVDQNTGAIHINIKSYLSDKSLDEDDFSSIQIHIKRLNSEEQLPVNFIKEFEVVLTKKK